MRAHEVKTRALAMPYKDSDPSQQKSRKCVFRPFLNRHQKKLFYSLLLIRQKYYESSKTEYSDSTSFINRLTPLIFFRVSKFFRGAKRGVPPKNFAMMIIRKLCTKYYVSKCTGRGDFYHFKKWRPSDRQKKYTLDLKIDSSELNG